MAEVSFDDDFRCATWTAGQGFDPIGSATTFDRLVTVEVPHPWPADVADLGWIAPLEIPDGVRVQAIVPESGRTGGDVLLTRWDRAGADFTGIDWLVPAADVEGALQVLVAGGEPAGDVSPAPDEILICSHGSRDRCCGGSGTRLAVEARAALPDVRVRRTSHLGGHRFAPTALTLPDGRMWAFLEPAILVGIVERTLPPSDAREFYRGNVALDPWCQVLEGAVLDESGWSAVAFSELTGHARPDDADRAEVRLEWCAGGITDERSGTVEISDRYPVLQCGLPPEDAEKSSAEYRLLP